MNILITGGAGYIGSHMAHYLVDIGENVVVVDNLSTGLRQLVPESAAFKQLDIRNTRGLCEIMREHNVDEVIHFAASSVVPDSVARPLAYYDNIVASSISLLQAMVDTGTKKIVFSSTAAVYGNSANGPITEGSALRPLSPYGRAKRMVEQILEDIAISHDIGYAALRYFNVAGADPAGRTGQSTPHATHLIKIACEVATGRRDSLTIHGTDYPTHDGTGVRDYIHVWDLVKLHHLAIKHLRDRGDNLLINCGYGEGFSVRDVIRAVEQAHGQRLNVQIGPRRFGDVAEAVASCSKAKAILDWEPEFNDIVRIARDALAWEIGAGSA